MRGASEVVPYKDKIVYVFVIQGNITCTWVKMGKQKIVSPIYRQGNDG